MSTPEGRESFAAKFERLAAKVDAELASILDPKQVLDRAWGRAERKSHARKGGLAGSRTQAKQTRLRKAAPIGDWP